AFQREVPQPPEAELAAPGHARAALVRNRDATEADPAEQALHEAVALAQLAQRIQCARREQAEVAGIGRHGGTREAPDHPVEHRGGATAQPAVAFARDAGAVDVVEALAPAR